MISRFHLKLRNRTNFGLFHIKDQLTRLICFAFWQNREMVGLPMRLSDISQTSEANSFGATLPFMTVVLGLPFHRD